MHTLIHTPSDKEITGNISNSSLLNREANVCVKVDGDLSDSFAIGMEVRQGYVMSPWLFNIFMDEWMREMKARVGKTGVRLTMNRVVWSVAAHLCTDDNVLPAYIERKLQRAVD